ncbi:MAG: S8 family serine peptidase, partial [Prolixibacteraceae bacterium]|nr:S8 family serine peptidase [Prolixibacteraceae bacterium]
EGLQIAVLDAGFYKANEFPVFDSLWINNRILGTKDFVNDTSDFFVQHYHGMSVLSIMGGNVPGELIGTAPEASYWLIRSEDGATEFLIEEDNWVAAAEFADSVGADIINSSLGYYLFDDSTMDHSYADMDGQTTRVSRGANIAASRGMLVVASAGNEGNDPWKYIIAPADGDDVIAVAATDRQNEAAVFTSYGPASDGDVKPNVAAIGYNTIIQRSNGSIGTGSGTSYSGPIIAGMAACLWQSNPEAKASEIKKAIEKSANLYSTPDSLLGYGIPDFMLADQILKLSGIQSLSKDLDFMAFPNPFSDRIMILAREIFPGVELNIRIVDVSGRIIKEFTEFSESIITLTGLEDLSNGFYSLVITTEENNTVIKLLK